MTISIIAALSQNRVIGTGNQLPWHLPADLRHFKALTSGKPIIMGRKTFLSIGKPLPERHNIVISHDKNFHAAGITIVHTIADALAAAGGTNEIMIIGGAMLFAQTMAIADRMYLTIIDKVFAGNVYFPVWSEKEWREVSRESHAASAGNPLSFAFVTLERINKAAQSR